MAATRFAAAATSKMSWVEAKKVIDSDEVEFVRLEFPNTNGVSSSYLLDAQYFLEGRYSGFAMNQSALDCLRNNEVFKEAFGPEFLRLYSNVKKYEDKLAEKHRAEGDLFKWYMDYYGTYA